MKRLALIRSGKILTFSIVLFLCCFVSSCGSSWNVSGNNIVINKADKPIEVPAGTYYILPDSLQ